MTQHIEVTATAELDTAQIARLFEDEFDGWCPVCKNAPIIGTEIICCACFQKALEFHTNICGCYP